MIKRNIICICSIFLSFCAFAQLHEDFDISSVWEESQWQGDIDLYKINKKGELQSNGVDAARATVYHPISLNLLSDDTIWEFYTKLSFNPSDKNYALIHLVSDREPLVEGYQGYFLQIGNKEDCITFCRRDNAGVCILFEGKKGRLNESTNPLWIKVVRTKAGEWTVLVKDKNSTEFECEGIIVDKTYTQTSFWGITSLYTSSRKNSFYFDDISVYQGNKSEENEEDDFIQPDGNDQIIPIDTLYQKFYYGNVVFNELMVNPKNAPGLPEVEYLELYNTTKETILLNGWSLCYGEKEYKFPPCQIEPHGYLLLMHSNKVELLEGNFPIAAFSSFPVLRNTGNFLALLDGQANVIHWLEYSDRWYQNNKKKEGGYSLECIDPINQSGTSLNWKASEASAGGTPAALNSVDQFFPDTIIPRLIDVVYDKKELLELFFSKPMLPESLSSLSNYNLTNSSIAIQEAVPIYPRYTSVLLKMNTPLVDTLQISSLVDRSGLSTNQYLIYCIQDSVLFKEKKEESSSSEEVVLEKTFYLEKDYIQPYSLLEEQALKIHYSFEEKGWMLCLTIYTLSGIKVERSDIGILPDTSGIITWPESLSWAQSLTPGIYVLYAECLHPQMGKVKKYKIPFVIHFGE